MKWYSEWAAGMVLPGYRAPVHEHPNSIVWLSLSEGSLERGQALGNRIMRRPHGEQGEAVLVKFCAASIPVPYLASCWSVTALRHW